MASKEFFEAMKREVTARRLELKAEYFKGSFLRQKLMRIIPWPERNTGLFRKATHSETRV